MNSHDPNVALVEVVARALGDLNQRVVFVGGCAVSLLITDTARPLVRATRDVDVIAEIATRAAYYELSEHLRNAGFLEDQDADVICRWRLGELRVDVMPTAETVFGFGNRWATQAVYDAQLTRLPSGAEIRLIAPPLLVAMKLEAFYNRGGGHYESSHDLEDIVNLTDGRAELVDEVQRTTGELRDYLIEEIDDLLGTSMFIDGLPWHLGPSAAEQARMEIVIERLRRMTVRL